MPTLIKKPTKIKAEGNKTKIIEEYIGRINSKTEDLSVAHMKSPSGWIEPGQQPEFDEYAIVLPFQTSSASRLSSKSRKRHQARCPMA